MQMFDNKFREWSDSDIAFLKDNYRRLDVNVLATNLRRSRPAILRMAQKLGIKGLLYDHRRRKIPEYADITYFNDGKVLIRYDNRIIHLASVPPCLCNMEIPV